MAEIAKLAFVVVWVDVDFEGYWSEIERVFFRFGTELFEVFYKFAFAGYFGMEFVVVAEFLHIVGSTVVFAKSYFFIFIFFK